MHFYFYLFLIFIYFINSSISSINLELDDDDEISFSDPREIEETLKKNTDVTNVAVVGLNHLDFGTLIFCVVTLKPDSMLDGNLLKEDCAKNLEKVKIPNEIIILDKIPKSSTGKLLRHELIQEVIRYSKYDGLEVSQLSQ